MKVLVILFSLVCFSSAYADDYSDRQAAARAASDAQYRKDMNDIKASITPLSRALIENMAVSHGGVSKFSIRVKSSYNSSNVYGEVRFSTKDNLVCNVTTVISYNCLGNVPGCPGQLPATMGCECYDSQNRRLFLSRDGSIQ